MLLSPRQADRTALCYDLVHDDFLGNSFLKDNRCSAIAFDAKCRKLCLAHFSSRQFSCGSAISVENKRSPVIGGNKLDCGDFLFLGHIRSPFCVGVSFTPTHVLQGLPRRVIVAKIRIKSIGVGLSATVFPNLQQALD